MKQGSIKYSKEFITPVGLKEWLSIEYPVDFDTENPVDVYGHIKSMIQECRQAEPKAPDLLPPGPPPEIQIQKTDESIRIGILAQDIISCQDLVTIDSYKLLVKGKPDLEKAYITRRHEIVEDEKKHIIQQAEKLINDKKRNS